MSLWQLKDSDLFPCFNPFQILIAECLVGAQIIEEATQMTSDLENPQFHMITNVQTEKFLEKQKVIDWMSLNFDYENCTVILLYKYEKKGEVNKAIP